mgnify:CR=1 FL=1
MVGATVAVGMTAIVMIGGVMTVVGMIGVASLEAGMTAAAMSEGEAGTIVGAKRSVRLRRVRRRLPPE